MTRNCVAGILQNPTGQILLLHRLSSRRSAADCWSVVSGHLKSTETAVDGIKREVQEELDLNLDKPVVRGAKISIGQQHVWPFLFEVTAQQVQQIKLNRSEHDLAKWTELSTLPEYATVPGLWNDLCAVQLRPRRVIIGVVGKNASGKDSVVDHLVYHHGFVKIHLSDFVKLEANRRRLALTRTNLHRLSQELIATEGPEVFSQRAIALIERHNWTKVAISGIRTVANVSSFTQFYNQGQIVGEHSPFHLWAVSVPSDRERFARMLVRASLRDPQTWSEFIEHERREEELFGVSMTEQLANLVLKNDQSLDYLHQQIDASVTMCL